MRADFLQNKNTKLGSLISNNKVGFAENHPLLNLENNESLFGMYEPDSDHMQMRKLRSSSRKNFAAPGLSNNISLVPPLANPFGGFTGDMNNFNKNPVLESK